MKIRNLIIIGILALSFSNLFAQRNNMVMINAGYVNPSDIKGGMFFGFVFGAAIDEAVDVGLGVDIFHKTYTEQSQVAEEESQGMTSKTYVTAVEYTRTMLPLSLNVNVKIPTSDYFGYFIRGGLNYEFLFSKESNYEVNQTQTRRFGGLGWQAAGGVFYRIGSRSTFVADVGYNSCQVSRNVKDSTKGLPTTEKVSLNGIGVRVGVSLDLR